MPPKKKAGGGSKKSSSASSKKSGGSSTKGSKKGKKGAKNEQEGPVAWKLSKDRLEMLKPDNLPVVSSIKAQVTEDLEHLHAPFPHRHPLKHWTLKNTEIPLQGIAGEDAQGVLFATHAPLYPVVDVCDRRAVSRCWRAIRCHFEPAGKLVGEESSDEEEEDIFGATNNDKKDDDDDPASCGPLTLHGLSRWLNNRGERFPAPGFPYDDKVWRPLEVVILKHFRKSNGGQIRARWKQPRLVTPLFLPSLSGVPGGVAGGGSGKEEEGGARVGAGGLLARRMRPGSGGADDNIRAEVVDAITDPAEAQKLKFEPPKPGQFSVADQVAIADARAHSLAADAALQAEEAAASNSFTEASDDDDRGSGHSGGGSYAVHAEEDEQQRQQTLADASALAAGELAALLASCVPLESDVDPAGLAPDDVVALEGLALGPELACVLSRKPACADFTDRGGDPALVLAAGQGLCQAVFALLRMGAFADQPSGRGGNTALHAAAQQGHVDCVKALLASGCDGAAQNACGESALHLASRQGHEEVVKVLLKEKTVLVSQYTAGGHHTALHYSAAGGHLAVLKQLDKAAAAESKKLGGGAGGKKGKGGGGKKGKKAKEGSGGARPTDDGPVGPLVEPATLNTLSHNLEPPLLRVVAALGGFEAVRQGDVLKDEANAGLVGALSFCGGKFKNPLVAKAGGKKGGGGDKKSGGDKKEGKKEGKKGGKKK